MRSSHARDIGMADASFQTPYQWLPVFGGRNPPSKCTWSAPFWCYAAGDNARIEKQVALSSLFHTKVSRYGCMTKSGGP